MKMRSLLLIMVLSSLCEARAQDAMDKFVSEICSCFKSLKPEAITSVDVINQAIEKCVDNSIAIHKKALKKANAIDWDKGASEAQVTNMWQLVFAKCEDASSVAFKRKEALENAENGNSFHGIIVYVQDLEVSGTFKKMGVTKDLVVAEMKKKGEWADTLYTFYHLGNYAKIGNNKEQSQKIYRPKENTIYSYAAIGDGICTVQEALDFALDGGPDKPASITELDSSVTVMGVPCKVIRMKWKIGQFDYYYNPSTAQVDPALFAKHTSEGFAQFVSMTKCLPLQTVNSAAGVKIIQTAVKVEEGKFDNKMFDLPELVEDPSLNAIKLPGMKRMRIKE